MVALTAAQERNLRQALVVTNNPDERVRLAFAIWSESRALIYANGGLNTSHSPGFDTHPDWPATLRRSLAIPHDAVGNNGRSVGMLQQTPSEVGGGWGSMAGCMVPAVSALRFLAALKVTDDPVFKGKLLQPDGTLKPVDIVRDPIAADVLRVQQPLASEAKSSNYDASQVAIAKAIVAQLFPTDDWILDMADQAALNQYADQVAGTVWEAKYNDPNAPDGQTWPTPMRAFIMETNRRVTGIEDTVATLAGLWDVQVNDPAAPEGESWPTAMRTFITESNRRIVAIEKAVAAIAAKLGA